MKREEELTVIKPLEWKEYTFNTRTAKTICGYYEVQYRAFGDGVVRWYWKRCGDPLTTSFESEDEAKAAAQSAYEARISSALLPTHPKPEVEPVAWLRHGEPIPVQGVPWGAMWITDRDDPKGFPVYALPPKPKPVGWETESEWELEMRCANITENTPFAEVSKLINDLWQQYCLAAEPKPEATEGGAHEKGFQMLVDAYIRGATWYRQNEDFGGLLHKAALDYADYVTSPATNAKPEQTDGRGE